MLMQLCSGLPGLVVGGGKPSGRDEVFVAGVDVGVFIGVLVFKCTTAGPVRTGSG